MMRTKYLAVLSLAFSLVFLFGCGEDEVVHNKPKNIKGVRSYKKEFNDLNDAQLAVAKRIGISPLNSRGDVSKVESKLDKLKSNDLYTVDKLTHSIPFLVPKARKLLETISRNFEDSLSVKGLNKAKPIVTSVLRTKEDIKKLRRTNVNSTENSAHLYATTFDITYKRYDKVQRGRGKIYKPANDEHLKKVMSEVLRDLKNLKKCFVKYEVKQGCFHITVR